MPWEPKPVMGRRFDLTFGDSLTFGHLREVLHVLQNGGLCVVPSDTCYALAGLPFRRDVISRLVTILERPEDEPIPLAFGTLQMAEQYAQLTAEDYRIIDTLCPGPLTIVCGIKDKIRKQIIEDMLHTHDSIGIRIPDSPIERQISNELQRPITTCAIRDSEHKVIQSFSDALDMVRERMRQLKDVFMLVAIEMKHIKYPDQSTVMTVQTDLIGSPYALHIFRSGAIEPRILERTISDMTYKDYEDWT